MASKLVVLLLLVFDLIAFGLAVAAEQRRSTARVLPDSEVMYSYCVYDSDVATSLGVGALLFLLLSQVILMVVSKCFCCGRGLSPGGPRACALVLFLFSWLTFLFAEACLLAGSVRNAHHTRYRSMFFNGNPSCETLRKGVFAAGAAFVLFTVILSEFYYVSFSKAASDSDLPPYGGPEVGMTTYKRRIWLSLYFFLSPRSLTTVARLSATGENDKYSHRRLPRFHLVAEPSSDPSSRLLI